MYVIRPGRYVVGRGKDCDIHVPHRSVSRRHAQLVCEKGTLSVRDLGSTNGTFVNGQRVNSKQLAAGSLLGVGGVVLEVREELARWIGHDDQLETPLVRCDEQQDTRLLRIHQFPAPRKRVCKLLAEGESEKQVAAHLGMNLNTVNWHASLIHKELGVHSKEELVALRHRLEGAGGRRDEQ